MRKKTYYAEVRLVKQDYHFRLMDGFTPVGFKGTAIENAATKNSPSGGAGLEDIITRSRKFLERKGKKNFRIKLEFV